MSAPSYSTEAWSPDTLARLRAAFNDAYPRPMIQESPDDEDEHDEDSCMVCRGQGWGSKSSARWAPNNGGAWVFSGTWQVAGDLAEYAELVNGYESAV